MANDTSNIADTWNCPNFVGDLFLIGANQTPFLNMIGGLNQGGKIVGSLEFDIAQTYALESAAQPSVTENDSLTAPTPVTYVRGRDANTCQFYHRKCGASYAKLAQSQAVSVVAGGAGTFFVDMTQSTKVASEIDFQIETHLRQIAVNFDYTCLNGAYQRAISKSVAPKSRGIVTAISTSSVDASSAALTTDLVEELLRTMAGNGAEWRNPVIFVNAFLKQKLTSLYAYAPQDRNVGGANIKQIETDFGMLGVVWDPHMDTNTLLVADMDVCVPVFCEVPGKGLLFYEELSKTGAAETGQLFGIMGLDYGPEELHGKLINVAN